MLKTKAYWITWKEKGISINISWTYNLPRSHHLSHGCLPSFLSFLLSFFLYFLFLKFVSQGIHSFCNITFVILPRKASFGIITFSFGLLITKSINQLDGVQSKARETVKRMERLIYLPWLKEPNMSKRRGKGHDNYSEISERCKGSRKETHFFFNLKNSKCALSKGFGLGRKMAALFMDGDSRRYDSDVTHLLHRYSSILERQGWAEVKCRSPVLFSSWEFLKSLERKHLWLQGTGVLQRIERRMALICLVLISI